MFDPLDFISIQDHSYADKFVDDPCDEAKRLENFTSLPRQRSDFNCINDSKFDDRTDEPILPIDLPNIKLASPDIILTILLLLQPNVQVNFSTSENVDNGEDWESICNKRGISPRMIDETVEYYRLWRNNLLQSRQQICNKVPQLVGNCYQQDMLNFYTSILGKFETSIHPLKEQILKEASLRISEKCGRTAQPTMTRIFKMEGLESEIKIREPSLTSDNLGLKTWGSSLILSQKAIHILEGGRVLELGAGTGLVGISYALSHKNTQDIYLTDLPDIVENLKHNVALNGLYQVKACVLDWTDPSTFTSEYGEAKFDTILVADPIYSEQHPLWIVQMILKFLSKSGTVYLQLPIRPKYGNERDMLWRLLKENQLASVKECIDHGKDDWGDVSYIYKEIKWVET